MSSDQGAVWNMVPPGGPPSAPTLHKKAKSRPYALLLSLEPLRGPDFFPMERFRRRWDNHGNTGFSRFTGGINSENYDITAGNDTPGRERCLVNPNLRRISESTPASSNRDVHTGGSTPRSSSHSQEAVGSQAPSMATPQRGFSLFGGKAYATPGSYSRSSSPQPTSTIEKEKVIANGRAGGGLIRFKTLAQQRLEQEERMMDGHAQLSQSDRSGLALGSPPGLTPSKFPPTPSGAPSSGSFGNLLRTPSRTCSYLAQACDASVTPIASSGRKRLKGPPHGSAPFISPEKTTRESPVGKMPAVQTKAVEDRSKTSINPSGARYSRTWGSVEVGNTRSQQKQRNEGRTASRGGVRNEAPTVGSRLSSQNKRSLQSPRSRLGSISLPSKPSPPARRYTLEDFAGADDVCFNPGASRQALTVFLERCEARGTVVVSMLWADLTTGYSAVTVKSCLPSKQCYRWNCACGRQPRALQATAPIVGAVIHLPPDGAGLTQGPSKGGKGTECGGGCSQDMEFGEGETYLLPLGACEGETKEAAVAGGYQLPLKCDSTYDERWSALAKLFVLPVKKIVYNAQVVLMPLVAWRRRSKSTVSFDPPAKDAGEGRNPTDEASISLAMVSELFDPRVAAWMVDTGSTDKGLEFEALCISTLKSKEEGGSALPGGKSAIVTAVVHLEKCSRRSMALAVKLSEGLREARMLKACEQVEMPAISILAGMEVSGVVFLPERVTRFSAELEKLLDGLRRSAAAAAGGRDFNLASPDQVADVLFKHLKLPSPPVKAGSVHASTSAEVLEGLLGKHPVVATVLEFRGVNKYKTTYVDKLSEKATGAAQADSAVPVANQGAGAVRIHAAWNQTAVRTGRLSCSRPNLQQIPKSSDPLVGVAGVNIRDAFVASKGFTLMAADYSQIEMRVLADACKDPALSELFASIGSSGGDIYRRLAAQVFGKEECAVSDHERTRAKVVCLGIIYGMGTPQVARKLEVTESQAQMLVKSLLKAFPKINDFLTATRRYARERGYVCTLTGRRRNLSQINNTQSAALKAQAERQAVNSVIQGTAADIIKTAMVIVARRLDEWRSGLEDGLDCPRLVMQIHDELVLECPACEEDLERLKGMLIDCMEVQAPAMVGIKCPLAVNMLVGMSWGSMRRVVSTEAGQD